MLKFSWSLFDGKITPVPDSPAASSLRYQMDFHVDERAPEGSPQEKGSQAPVGNGSPSKHNWTAIEGDGEAAANSFYAYSTSTLPVRTGYLHQPRRL